MLHTLITIICSVICSIFYRAGGLAQEADYWIPIWMRKRNIRLWGCPFFMYLPLFFSFAQINWFTFGWFMLAYLLTGGALSTYWDEFFGYDNHWFAGFIIAIASFPMMFVGMSAWYFIIRCLALPILWGVLSNYVEWKKWFNIQDDHGDEHSRGAALPCI